MVIVNCPPITPACARSNAVGRLGALGSRVSVDARLPAAAVGTKQAFSQTAMRQVTEPTGMSPVVPPRACLFPPLVMSPPESNGGPVCGGRLFHSVAVTDFSHTDCIHEL